MAKESGRHNSADELKAELARSRARLAREWSGLRYELDIPSRIRRSFQEQTALWIGAAAVVGTILVVLPMRRRKSSGDVTGSGKTKRKLVEAGFALGALRIAASLLKPVIVNFVVRKMRDYGDAGPAERNR